MTGEDPCKSCEDETSLVVLDCRLELALGMCKGRADPGVAPAGAWLPDAVS